MSKAMCKTCHRVDVELLNPMTNHRGNMCKNCFDKLLGFFKLKLLSDYPKHSEDKFKVECSKGHKVYTCRAYLRNNKREQQGACSRCAIAKQSHNKNYAWIYFAKDKHNYKIGFTTNLKHRTRDLKTNRINIIEHKIYNDVSKADKLEIQIHNYLDELKVRPNNPRYISCGGHTELISRRKIHTKFKNQDINLDWFLQNTKEA